MKISKYFETAVGRGVLATTDADGRIDMAPFPRPHVVDEETIAFPMTDRRAAENLQVHPRATYLFLEEGPDYNGKRLYLTKLREEQTGEMVELLQKKNYPDSAEKVESIVFFKVDEVLPLLALGEKREVATGA